MSNETAETMGKGAKVIRVGKKVAGALLLIAFVCLPLAILALPTCIVYWWIGMSGHTALAIDIIGTTLIGACFVTVAYYAD